MKRTRFTAQQVVIIIILIVLAVFMTRQYMIRPVIQDMASNQEPKVVGDSLVTLQSKVDKASSAQPLSTKYIRAQDWPPQIALTDGPLTCTEAGSEMGKTEREIINGHEYCVTIVSEGAAGSTYTSYAYGFVRGDKVAMLTFTLKAVQCGNYDDPEKTACEEERGRFNIGQYVDYFRQSTM